MIKVNGITITPNLLSLEMGSKTMVEAMVSPTNATCQDVTWHCNDTDIVNVNKQTGVVDAIGVGKTTIYAKTTDGSGLTAEIDVTVYPKPEEISFGSSFELMGLGDQVVFTINVYPVDALNKGFTWYCTDNNTLSVERYLDSEDKLLVTAKALGNAVIKVTANGNYMASDCCGFNVVEPIPVKSLTLNQYVKVLGHDESFIISREISPDNATNKRITWTSSNPDVATVDRYGSNKAKVTSKRKDGTAVITANLPNFNDDPQCTVIVDSRPIVTVTEDNSSADNFYNVTFPNGLVWKSIGKDLTGLDTIVYRDFFDRYNHNALCTYSDEQLALLYSLDPIGVAYYIKYYAIHHKDDMLNYVEVPANEHYDFNDAAKRSAALTLYFKDYMYELIFNEPPTYFLVNDNGERYAASLSNGRYNVYSDAELVFGGHSILDDDSILELALDFIWEYIKAQLEDLFDFSDIETAFEIAQIAFVSKSVADFSGALLEKTLEDFINNYADKAIKAGSSYGLVFLPWKIYNVINDMADAIDAIFITLEQEEIAACNKINKQFNYRVVFEKGTQKYFVEELIDSLTYSQNG